MERKYNELKLDNDILCEQNYEFKQKIDKLQQIKDACTCQITK